MEGLLGALAFLAIAACCGLPILLLGAARLINGNKNRQEEISSARQERMHETNDLDRTTLVADRCRRKGMETLNIDKLREEFNRASGSVRLVTILSPT